MAAPASEAGKEAAKEAVKQTANETARQAAQEPSGPLQMLLANPLLAVLAVISVIAVAIIGAIIFIAYSSRDTEEEFEKQDLSDIVQPEFVKVVKDQGKKNKSKLRRDLRTEGEVWRDVRFKENDNLVKHLKALANGDGDFDTKLSLEEPDEDELQKLYADGVYNQQEVQEIKSQGLVPHRLMWIRPAGILDKVMWLVTDRFMGRDWFSRFALIPEHRIKDNMGDGSISIDRNIQLRPFAGIELPLYFESFAMLHAVVMRTLYEGSLEDQVNYSEKVNFFDSKFSQRIQELEAEAAIEDKRYESKVAGDVNKS